jgi:deazaflavin-dependent oxidoreductase (nitroreductase family)
MTTANDRDQGVIEEFRSRGGRVGGNFEGAPILLMHTVGAKTGEERVTPVMYLADGERWVVFASKAGAPNSPSWYHNLVAKPDMAIEVGTETIDVRATIASPEERDPLYARQAAAYPQFGEYEKRTSRKIPVVIFTRRA